MSHENPIGHALPSYVESQSFDPNKFERVLIFDRLQDISYEIHSTEKVTQKTADAILHEMDNLATIGYFFSTDTAPHKNADDLISRGINPDAQDTVENAIIQQNDAYFYVLLENIFYAQETPSGFIKKIKDKIKSQIKSGVRNLEGILANIEEFEKTDSQK